MDGGFNSQDEFSAELFLAGQRLGQRNAVAVKQFNPFLDGFTQFGVNLRFFGAMHRAREKLGAAADKAVVFIAPFNVFYVTRGLFFDLFASHKQTSICYFTASNARFTSPS